MSINVGRKVQSQGVTYIRINGVMKKIRVHQSGAYGKQRRRDRARSVA